MKFSLTITDMTREEISSLSAFLNGGASIQTADIAAKMAALTGPSGNGASHDKAMMTTALQMPNDDDNAPANINAPAADTSGLPWDERIHSRNKGLNADGTWRKKRGVDGAMVAAVEAELKMRGGTQFQPQPMPNAVQTMPPQFTAPSSHVQMPHHTGMHEQQPQPQYQQQPQPMPNGQFMPPPNGMPPQGMPNGQYMQPPAPVQLDFTGFMQHLSGQMAKRDQNGQPLIHTDYLASVVQRLSAQFGRQFNSITDVSGDPNAINAAVALITADGRWN